MIFGRADDLGPSTEGHTSTSFACDEGCLRASRRTLPNSAMGLGMQVPAASKSKPSSLLSIGSARARTRGDDSVSAPARSELGMCADTWRARDVSGSHLVAPRIDHHCVHPSERWQTPITSALLLLLLLLLPHLITYLANELEGTGPQCVARHPNPIRQRLVFISLRLGSGQRGGRRCEERRHRLGTTVAYAQARTERERMLRLSEPAAPHPMAERGVKRRADVLAVDEQLERRFRAHRRPAHRRPTSRRAVRASSWLSLPARTRLGAERDGQPPSQAAPTQYILPW
eukprot:scaffold26231_cov29-Tisochrysis_lutea.AAC.4